MFAVYKAVYWLPLLFPSVSFSDIQLAEAALTNCIQQTPPWTCTTHFTPSAAVAPRLALQRQMRSGQGTLLPASLLLPGPSGLLAAHSDQLHGIKKNT